MSDANGVTLQNCRWTLSLAIEPMGYRELWHHFWEVQLRSGHLRWLPNALLPSKLPSFSIQPKEPVDEISGSLERALERDWKEP